MTGQQPGGRQYKSLLNQKKLHEIEKILGRGGHAGGAPPLDPPLTLLLLFRHSSGSGST